MTAGREVIATDVLIIGAGFVGLACACAMRGAGLRVTVIDQKVAPSPMPSRRPSVEVEGNRLSGGIKGNVIAVNPASMQFLTDIGAWEFINPSYVAPYQQMEVFDGTGAGAISFHAEDAGAPALGYIVDQQALTAALIQRTAQLPYAKLCWQQVWRELLQGESGYRVIMSDGREVATQLLIGADGSSSKIRETVGLRKAGWRYGQNAIVCVAQSNNPHGGVARQWFTRTGPVAMLPLPEPHLSAVIWSTSDSRQLLGLSDEDFCHALDQSSEQPPGEVRAVSARLSFPLMQQQAMHYVSRGIALIGDAAHTIHPLAGQGANLGFADAQALAGVLHQSRIEGRSPGDTSLLRRYEVQRKPANQLAGVLMEGFHRLFTAGYPALAFLRNRGLRLVDHNEKLKKLAVSLATGRFLDPPRALTLKTGPHMPSRDT